MIRLPFRRAGRAGHSSRPRRAALLAAGLLAALLIAGPVIAWSALGHKLVGALAQRHLDPAARAEVARLLAGEPDPTLAGVATWADTLRDSDPDRFKQTSRWHYVNLSSDSCRYAPERDCKDGQCVIGAIAAQRAILADRTQPDAARRDALKFLVHFVGDVHQPLHANARNDQGGNKYQVSLRTDIEPEAYARDRYIGGVMGTNLHSVWDYYVLAERGLDLAQYADRLDREPWPPVMDASAATPAAWASESCALTELRQLYPKQNGQETHKLDQGYSEKHRALAEQRIRIAAYRLATLLNQTLGQAQ
ncbi:S1/P1 nuclease [Lysobacter solisilvae (ex Woo and Kim 2020)]|uniref:S1/P1 nuclease n=1 Tax=Agrilutibacter terrestris TaxID=2865112 RepID=A0A7H0FUS1_9GAMM|nr:S1/P1 nuclease [Lysobacter terrestris]QNP39787.1 S1/P1 nuclease [Lysobacter terrestris]